MRTYSAELVARLGVEVLIFSLFNSVLASSMSMLDKFALLDLKVLNHI
jgi:hypothetical protein